MASRMMHFAIAKYMNQYNQFLNYSRYEIGQILPDAITHDMATHAVSHFKATVCEGRKKVIDFAEFRATFADEIVTDDLYLGYYLHLIQDGIYRKYLYNVCGYKVTCQEDVEVLHNDYRLLNSYLVSKYHLEYHAVIPEGFETEKINRVYPFLLDNFLRDMGNDFVPYQNGKTKIFTEQMVDEYINECTEICCRELLRVKAGQTCVNPMDYAWELPTKG